MRVNPSSLGKGLDAPQRRAFGGSGPGSLVQRAQRLQEDWAVAGGSGILGEGPTDEGSGTHEPCHRRLWGAWRVARSLLLLGPCWIQLYIIFIIVKA